GATVLPPPFPRALLLPRLGRFWLAAPAELAVHRPGIHLVPPRPPQDHAIHPHPDLQPRARIRHTSGLPRLSREPLPRQRLLYRLRPHHPFRSPANAPPPPRLPAPPGLLAIFCYIWLSSNRHET